MVKVILGVLGDDELGMDLSVVDPLKVVRGGQMEMGVVVMALCVCAKRRGLLVLPDEEMEKWAGEDLMDEEDEEGVEGVEVGYTPLQPDISWSKSNGRLAQTPNMDQRFNAEDAADSTYTDREADTSYGRIDAHPDSLEFDPFITPVKQQDYHGPQTPPHTLPELRPEVAPTTSQDNWRDVTTSTTRRRRTVLQDMMEEFGLG